MDEPFATKEAVKLSLTASFVANNKAAEHDVRTRLPNFACRYNKFSTDETAFGFEKTP
jgi:hypothetical protein